ncbi:MAG: hypothetical protein PVI51_05495 [candidate division WOR-3 bacterium]|jgi:hypothetical protein
MKKLQYAAIVILVIVSTAQAGPLLWRGPKTVPSGKPVFMIGLGYSITNKNYNWVDEEWTEIAGDNQTTVINSHFMLGYAPVKKWEVMAHVPVMYKSRDTLSSLGLQDIWVKTRYNLLGDKTTPYLTGVAAVRIPTASEDADILLDDRTLDFALGALFMQTFKPVVIHLKAGYWLNGTKETATDTVNVGDNIEIIFKPEYVFTPKVKVFLNFTWVETFKSKDEDGNDIDNSEKRRLTVVPGIVAKPIPGLSVRPKVIFPIDAVNKGGSNFTWKLGLDVWFVPK